VREARKTHLWVPSREGEKGSVVAEFGPARSRSTGKPVLGLRALSDPQGFRPTGAVARVRTTAPQPHAERSRSTGKPVLALRALSDPQGFRPTRAVTRGRTTAPQPHAERSRSMKGSRCGHLPATEMKMDPRLRGGDKQDTTTMCVQ